MKRIARGWMLSIVVILFCLLLGTQTEYGYAEDQVVATYTPADGIVITSYSPNWADQSKLKALHDELLQNVHGEELEMLGEIEIHDDYPRGKGVAGQYVFQSITTLFSSKQKMQPGKIELYGGSEHTTVASFAHTLAHEYGHHVTHYYTLKIDGFPLTDDKKWGQTSYARMRGLTGDERIGLDDEVHHRWQIAELAAEDYVQLFGSPLAKAHTEFASRVEQARQGEEPSIITWTGSMFNVQPQENHDVPLASEVPGLYEFFHKAMKGDTGAFKPPAKPDFKLESYSKQGDVGYLLRFTWNVPDEQADYRYTLVTYNDGDHLVEPIVTRTAEDAKEGYYGPIIVQKGPVIYTYTEPHAEGIRHFKLFVFGENGWVTDSSVLTVNMDDPKQVTINDNVVVPVTEVEGVSAEPDIETMLSDFLFEKMEMDWEIDLSWLDGVVEFLDTAIQFVGSLIDLVFGETVEPESAAISTGMRKIAGFA